MSSGSRAKEYKLRSPWMIRDVVALEEDEM
jgi:hypothetical protein